MSATILPPIRTGRRRALDRLTSINAFLRVAESGGFTAAAARLGVGKSRVSKQVQALERHLGTRLLHRTTRRLTLTEAGQRFYEQCAPLLEALSEAEMAVGDLQSLPRGTLRINAPVSFGRLHLGPVLPEFLARYPSLTVDITLNDRFVDLVHEGFDAAVRIGQLQESTLIARRIAACELWLCAAPGYLARHGTPVHAAELHGHNALAYTYAPQSGSWRLTDPDGQAHRIPVEGSLRANNGELLLEAAERGSGIVMLPDFIAAGAVAAGRLQRLLPDHATAPLSLNAVYPYTPRVPAKVRAFVDFLVERFGSTPDWQGAAAD